MRFHNLLLLAAAVIFFQLVYPVQTNAGIQKGRYYFEKRGEIIWEVPTERKLISLTFDDGPNPNDTPKVLDVLKKYHAKATFFVIGEHVLRYPKLTKRIVKEGHELGNHTFSHPSFHNLSSERIHQEIEEGKKAIASVSGKNGRLFRPPGGAYNEKIVREANKEGYKVILWSWDQDTKDWSRPGVDKIARNVIENASNGDIILFHDHTRGRSQTIEALQKILPKLKAKGYRFVTVSDLLAIHQQEKWLKREMLP